MKTKVACRQDDIDVLMDFLRFPLGSADAILARFARLPGAIRVGEGLSQFVFVEGTRTNRVLLVAHADTCWDMLYRLDKEPVPQNVELKDGIIRNPGNGLGADDRAGCAILWLLRDLGHSLLITNGEEYGEIGSAFLMNERTDIADKINHEHQFALAFDRKNAGDFKCYAVGTEEFKRYIEKETGYLEAGRASSTDISTICRNICGANLSVGYQNEHTDNEYLVVADWRNTLQLCRRWLSKDPLPEFPLDGPDPDYQDIPEVPYQTLPSDLNKESKRGQKC